MSAWRFDGRDEVEWRTFFEGVYDGVPTDLKTFHVDKMIAACEAYATSADTRPYPDYVDDTKQAARLRDATDYAFHRDGYVFNSGTRSILRPDKKGLVKIRGESKAVYALGIRAFYPVPDIPSVSVDHIDYEEGHALHKLRYASKSLQAVNRTLPERFKSSPIVVSVDGVAWVKHETMRDFTDSVGLDKSVRSHISTALKYHRQYKQWWFKWWQPTDAGEWRPVPDVFIRDNSGYNVSEFGGWVMRPDGSVTQGHLGAGGYYVIKIQGYVYKVHRMTCCGFHGLPPSPNAQGNHMRGVANGPADAAALEWTTGAENVVHSVDTGLAGYRLVPVVCIDANGQRRSYESMKAAVEDTGVTCSNISQVCLGKRKSARGMHFEYVNGPRCERVTK